MKILVTGGAGFIGNRLMRDALAAGHHVTCVDAISYAASVSGIWDLEEDPNYTLEACDVRDQGALERVFALHRPEAVIHLAAETDKARGLMESAEHLGTNVAGTRALLEVATAHWREAGAREDFRFLHVSTGEVFGSLSEEASAEEDTFGDDAPHRPEHPNAATKAAADHLVRAWGKTQGLPVITTHGSATYGPWQHPEKLVPMVLSHAIAGQPIALPGAGTALRDWIHVEDHACGILAVLADGRVGESYNISASDARRDVDLARALCRLLQVHRPAPEPYTRLMAAAGTARGGGGSRSVLDGQKLERELGWRPRVGLDEGLAQTVEWYCANHGWWLPLMAQMTGRDAAGSPSERNVA